MWLFDFSLSLLLFVAGLLDPAQHEAKQALAPKRQWGPPAKGCIEGRTPPSDGSRCGQLKSVTELQPEFTRLFG